MLYLLGIESLSKISSIAHNCFSPSVSRASIIVIWKPARSTVFAMIFVPKHTKRYRLNRNFLIPKILDFWFSQAINYNQNSSTSKPKHGLKYFTFCPINTKHMKVNLFEWNYEQSKIFFFFFNFFTCTSILVKSGAKFTVLVFMCSIHQKVLKDAFCIYRCWRETLRRAFIWEWPLFSIMF